MTKARPYFLVVLLAIALGGVSRAEEPAPFPQPRDDDGRFANLAGPLDRAGIDVTFPFFLRRIGKIFAGSDGIPAQVQNDGAFLRANATASVPTITWIGHATMLVQMEHQSFLTDPMWSKRASPLSWAGPKRFHPPGVAQSDLPPIDFVVVSHNHYDHLDLDSLVEIATRNPNARFFVPLENGALLRDAGIEHVEEMGWGQIARSGDLEIHCLPTQHWSRRGAFDGMETLWASWAVVGPNERFYFAGDTGYFAGFKEIGARLGPFDLAAVPIGAYRPREMMKVFHMDPAEAVQAGRDVQARALIGMHYGTFDLSDEPPSEPPELFRAAGRVAGYGQGEIRLPAIGQPLVLSSGEPAVTLPLLDVTE
ncbi:MAG: MBL fold metallo-hydrolase [Candidatus Binatia bacterium]|nr:MBL fold metallo-hydrolase [Candidatus Binatia bacterium]